MNPYALLADAMLTLHVCVVMFLLLGQALILIGGPRRWAWVRGPLFRYAHLGVMGFVAVQTWLGQLCPLTIWEQALRARAGQTGYAESFIEHWLSRLLFIEAPWWVFVVAYSAFFALVVFSWWRWPPQRRRG
ncbi:MAG: DUF2784 domain-containing protein [Pseudomarimonas sp.]